MGEARRRGTFEERKAQAIKRDRGKAPKARKMPNRMNPALFPFLVEAAMQGTSISPWILSKRNE